MSHRENHAQNKTRLAAGLAQNKTRLAAGLVKNKTRLAAGLVKNKTRLAAGFEYGSPGWIRTTECLRQRQMPYRLATGL